MMGYGVAIVGSPAATRLRVMAAATHRVAAGDLMGDAGAGDKGTVTLATLHLPQTQIAAPYRHCVTVSLSALGERQYGNGA
jgi:hypothetical protein